MVVLFLPVGGSAWAWYNPADILPYEACLAAKEREGHAAIRDRKFKWGEQLRQGMLVGGLRGRRWRGLLGGCSAGGNCRLCS